jgi:hypothetical protein
VAWGLGILAFVCVAAARWAWRSAYLFDLDSILYARALDNFDLRLSQPALPGYYLYIQAVRAVRLVLADANLSLVFVSAILGLLMVGSVYLLARDLFDTRTGVVAAVLALSGPVFWYQSSFASPRIGEAFFATCVVWLGIRVRLRGDVWAFWLLPVVLAVAGGFRQQVLLYMLPFCVWATWRVPWSWRLAGAVIGLIIIATWALPTLAAAGGLDQYRVLSAAQWDRFVVHDTGVLYGSSVLDSLTRLSQNVGRIVIYTFFTCLIAPAVAVMLSCKPRLLARQLGTNAGQALVLASAPALLFFAFIHIQQIGHIVAVAPFVVIVIARVLTKVAPSRLSTISILVAVGLNVAFIFVAPARLIGNQIGTPSIATIRERDRFIGASIAAIESGTASETLVLTSPLAYGFVEEYAPGYQYYLLPLPSLGAGSVQMPPSVRRLVIVSYEQDLSRLIQPASAVTHPHPGVATLGVVQIDQPTDLQVADGQLTLAPR